MAYTERIVGDPKNITRREMIAGVASVAITLILGTAIGGAAVGGYKKVRGYIEKRINALYANDEARALRISHANEEVTAAYEQFLSPGGVIPARTELSHRLLHTTYGEKVNEHIEELKKISVEEAAEETAAFMKAQK